MTNKIKSPVPDVWSTVPWLIAHRIGGHDRSMTASAEQTHSEQTPAGIAEATPDESNGGES